MKIAYLFLEDLSQENGVAKKIQSQMNAWQKRGAEVCIISKFSESEMWEGIGKLPVKKILFKEEGNRDAELDEFGPDIIYSRHYLSNNSINKYLNSASKIVIEINSDIKAETKLRLKTGKKIRYAYLFFRRYIPQMLKASKTISQADGFVFVSNELTHRYKTGKKPYCVIANGIELQQYPITQAPQNDKPRLVFMGTPGLGWHGVDKIVTMARHFPSWHFDIIGYRPEDLEWAKPTNVQFHGHLSREQYEPILARADAAIGTLSLYEKKMEEACPLKVREYLAYGLPVINGYKDSDFPNGAPFLLQLPNTLTNVEENLETLREFVQNWMGKRVERKYIEPIDVAMKEKERLAFFERVIIE